ncbi:hypothetical protein AGMMS49940_07030 [Spirochaetia bacterium]|nr:hypothetical protein AGMMS49940_07030 [Spirochaetia bacterium]
MIRIEIIANHSVEENILEALAAEHVGQYYTRYPVAMGVGHAGPKMGDAIWPEENFVLVIWCEEAEAQGIERAVATVKASFPDEGIKLFGLRSSLAQGALPAPAVEAEPEPEPLPEGVEGLAGLAGLE